MNLADLFLRELEKDENASPAVRMLGKKLAEAHKQALDTTAEFARMQCDWHRKLDALGLDPLQKLLDERRASKWPST